MTLLPLRHQILPAYLQAKVRVVAPSAVFVHCYAHHLNLVLIQGLNSMMVTFTRMINRPSLDDESIRTADGMKTK